MGFTYKFSLCTSKLREVLAMEKLLNKLVDLIYAISRIDLVKKIVTPIVNQLYRIYERWLYNQIKNGPMPRHVAIIPDGNRRWARKQGLNVTEGHVHGYERLREVIQWLFDLGVRVVTVYAMSYENCLYRSLEERENLFKLALRGFKELLNSDMIYKYRIRVKVIGKLELVPKEVRDYAIMLEQITSGFDERFLNIALCYGGRQEIVEAIKMLANDLIKGRISPEAIDEYLISRYLSTSHLSELSEPDLVIRTAGEMRISNFLLWQIAYSELYFCDVLWPELRKIDLLRAIRAYQRRERRFGR